MKADDMEIAPLGEADLAALAAFMRSQGGANTSEEQLRHWYLRNPTGSSTVMIGRIGGRIVGMATTNDHRFLGPEASSSRLVGGSKLVGMPQKVLTDATMRGKGLFGRLYHASEEEGRRKGIGFFLTVTNAASTPIFLGRFGYVRLPSPRLLVLAPAWGAVQGRSEHVPWPATQPLDVPSTWRMHKDEAHYRWRYTDLPAQDHQHHTFAFNDGNGGHVILKRMVRKGVPFMLLMDLVPLKGEGATRLLLQARRIAGRGGCVALVALSTESVTWAARGMPRIGLSSRMNLLVKGLDEAHTRALAAQRFELAFGDLDFL